MKKPMKIISLTTTYPESPKSTKPRFVHALNKEFVKLGIQTVVICPHSVNSKTNFSMDSVQIRFFKYLPEKFEISFKSIPDLVNTKAGKLKVLLMIIVFFLYSLSLCSRNRNYFLHGHWAFPGGYIAYLISKVLNKKFIVTVHGSELPLLERFSFLKKIVVKCLNNSFRVIASNDYLKNKLIKLGVHKEKIELIKPIPNFVSHVDQKSLKQFKEKITKDDKIILYVGRLTEVKGVEYLIKAIDLIKLRNIHLVIAGDGVLCDKLKKLCDSLNLQNKITFFGPATSDDLSLLYGASDVFVLPSIETSDGAAEGTGLVILEAMESGLPVITSSVGGIVNTVKNGVNGLLVPEKNPKEIANAIERVIDDEEFAKKIVENSKPTVKEFAPSIIAQKYYKIFEKIVTK